MKVLYICTHNRCRSILSEAITNFDTGELIEARSAGSQPAGEVHPLSLQYLEEGGYPTQGLVSQSWDDHEAFAPDVVITVCDSAAGEACPVWFGNSVKVHWGLSDPSKVEGTQAEKAQAFRACIATIKHRVAELALLARQGLQGEALKTALEAKGAR